MLVFETAILGVLADGLRLQSEPLPISLVTTASLGPVMSVVAGGCFNPVPLPSAGRHCASAAVVSRRVGVGLHRRDEMQCECSNCGQRFFWTGTLEVLLKLFCGKCKQRHQRRDCLGWREKHEND